MWRQEQQELGQAGFQPGVRGESVPALQDPTSKTGPAESAAIQSCPGAVCEGLADQQVTEMVL